MTLLETLYLVDVPNAKAWLNRAELRELFPDYLPPPPGMHYLVRGPFGDIALGEWVSPPPVPLRGMLPPLEDFFAAVDRLGVP